MQQAKSKYYVDDKGLTDSDNSKNGRNIYVTGVREMRGTIKFKHGYKSK